jgi:hypothetical protein
MVARHQEKLRRQVADVDGWPSSATLNVCTAPYAGVTDPKFC